MKIPKLFVPEDKDLDEKVRKIIQDATKAKRIENILSLADLPQIIGDYFQRTQPEKIQKVYWDKYFGDRISQYINEAIETTYMEPNSTFFTCIRILGFKSKTLDEANKVLDLKVGLSYNWQTMKIVSLKKDDCIVTMRKNQLDKGNSLEVIGNYYQKNFGMEDL